MYHFRGSAGGTGREIVAFQQQSFQAGFNRFPENASPNDTTPNDNNIPWLL
jgi:hypothetical protein